MFLSAPDWRSNEKTGFAKLQDYSMMYGYTYEDCVKIGGTRA
jgi:hypothetical protein